MRLSLRLLLLVVSQLLWSVTIAPSVALHNRSCLRIWRFHNDSIPARDYGLRRPSFSVTISLTLSHQLKDPHGELQYPGFPLRTPCVTQSLPGLSLSRVTVSRHRWCHAAIIHYHYDTGTRHVAVRELFYPKSDSHTQLLNATKTKPLSSRALRSRLVLLAF